MVLHHYFYCLSTMSSIYLFFILSTMIIRSSASQFPIDNDIMGEPTVDCEDAMVGLTFKTKKPFTGRVYVQGLSDDESCSRAFVNNKNQSRMSMEVKNGDCTMQRHRVTGKMEGLMFSLTMIVSFHGTFVTRADRAYRCICFFRNQKALTNSIQIGPIGTTEVLNTGSMPTCSYSIRSGSIDGPPVVYGEVGERIFHVWTCDSTDKGFLVHSCQVTDGRGFRFDLLDVDGCAIDPVIQPDVVYDTVNNMAVAETFGYKFSDTNMLQYECVVEICSKTNGECADMTPPVCDRNEDEMMTRKRRAIRDGSPNPQNVVASINMVDSMKEAEVFDKEELMPSKKLSFESWVLQDSFCLSPLWLSVMAAGLTIFSISCILLVIYLSRIHTYVLSTAYLSRTMTKPPQQP